MLWVILNLLIYANLHTSIPVIWERNLGSPSYDFATSMVKTGDGFLIAGVTYSSGGGDILVIKTDKEGNVQWQKSFGVWGKLDIASDLIQVTEGYLLVGRSVYYIRDDDVYIVKLDLNGRKIWERKYGGMSKDRGYAVVETEDGYLIVGETRSYGKGNGDLYLIKIDKSGNKVWEKIYGGEGWDQAKSAIKVEDGYIIAGFTTSLGKGDQDVYVIKIDKNGEKIWEHTYGGKGNDGANSITKSKDGFIVVGYTNSFGSNDYDFYILKLNKNGGLVWDKVYGKEGIDVANAIIQTEEGYVIAGRSDSLGADVYLLKINENGEKVWDKRIGGIGNDWATSIVEDEDGYVVAGFNYSKGNGGDVYLLKVGKHPVSLSKKKVVSYKEEKRIEPEESHKQKHFPKFPADLIISNVKFTEPSGNKVLDAGETGKITFLITNRGKGKATDVKVNLYGLSGIENIGYNKTTIVGDILPGMSKIIEIEVHSLKEATEGEAKLRIETTEKFGFDADPFIISFRTKKLELPNLVIADVGIDDDKEGDSYGDNDGIIERGEAVEISVAVQNIGKGNASNTSVEIMGFPEEGKNLFYSDTTRIFNLGEIISGSYKIFKFTFMTNKRFTLSTIPVVFKIKSEPGEYERVDSMELNVGSPSQYTKEITIAATPEPTETVHRENITLTVDVDHVPEISKVSHPERVAVIIGIEEYKYAPNAEYANRDAVIFYEYAKKVLGIPERNIYIRTNEDATKGEFDKIFGANGWLTRRVVPRESEVFVYYSGHGAPDIETGEPYIIPYDIDPNYASSAFPLQELFNSLSSLKAKSVFVFLDACFSGLSKSNQLLFAYAKPLVPVRITTHKNQGINVFTASTGSQISSVYPEKKHGLFTYYLLKGLRGEANVNKDSVLTTWELYSYIKPKVEEWAKYMDREQSPTFSGDSGKVILNY